MRQLPYGGTLNDVVVFFLRVPERDFIVSYWLSFPIGQVD
ncbi:hypothetical protein Mar181_3154 [Marinomonas posidonica IVIA-Po-181]|uniref:Uncharacterized protein n=1 Tax=Marinomonas posidonica (strain CECT 7376 / NCIMB 14433 / IVIA-Po-181) TaxID=491952 RepID=F6CSM0_MARPP|nr:hypothetical protein Mar181_3154 [Marinomonas posidonica IVIA-Po-181]